MRKWRKEEGEEERLLNLVTFLRCGRGEGGKGREERGKREEEKELEKVRS